ncbi:hypothetical protein LTR47_006618 [Exophiala xenobiotica]|nr:hypothetical protein LTR92_007485 [Exophiala xenobiotica]KAK5207676.1 hypothetical protein LTR41_006720 [Exophiala xenobiotica]KAK5232405.1 hypothetical protein LTR47_006618 [Exophiala xenobiotica]KAK5245057.1 hypothetical protein LTS06_009460 [Exophiala xenobiotica]KAK5317045.1 hypothetical protein LTR93_008820 [Exophiala xenobiotica]
MAGAGEASGFDAALAVVHHLEGRDLLVGPKLYIRSFAHGTFRGTILILIRHHPTPKQKRIFSQYQTQSSQLFLTQPILNFTYAHNNSTMSGYDSYYSQGYQNQNQNQNQYSSYNQPASTSYSSSSYPSDGFSGSGSQSNPYQTQQSYYYQDNRAPHDQYDGSNNSYYNSSSQPTPTPLPGQEADRGMMGAMAGGAAGAFGGHKAGHGFLGSIGGAIIGSLAEDYAKKNKKNKNKHHHHKAGSSHSNSNSMMGGGGSLGSTASSFFNRKN